MAIPRSWPAGFVLIVCVVASLSCGYGADPNQRPETSASRAPRNPFGLDSDVPDCCGADVQAFADGAPDLGKANDPNAEPWAGTSGGPDAASIEGEWSSRWMLRGQDWVVGKATIRILGDRVFIHYTEEADHPVDYLIEAERRGDRLIGRYIHPGNPQDTSPWVGTIVDNRRIDGVYLMGRWDFRRGVEGADTD